MMVLLLLVIKAARSDREHPARIPHSLRFRLQSKRGAAFLPMVACHAVSTVVWECRYQPFRLIASHLLQMLMQATQHHCLPTLTLRELVRLTPVGFAGVGCAAGQAAAPWLMIFSPV